MRKTFIVATLLTILAAATPAFAHRPEQPGKDNLTLIPNVSTSYAYYREFTSIDEFHIYQLEADAGEKFHAGINIPQIKGLETFGVTFALVGPGFDAVESGTLPFSAKENVTTMPSFIQDGLRSSETGKFEGLVIANEVSENFYEPFTQTNYWGRQSIDVEIPESANYYLIVWPQKTKPANMFSIPGTGRCLGLATYSASLCGGSILGFFLNKPYNF